MRIKKYLFWIYSYSYTFNVLSSGSSWSATTFDTLTHTCFHNFFNQFDFWKENFKKIKDHEMKKRLHLKLELRFCDSWLNNHCFYVFLLVAVAFWLIFWWKVEIRFFVADLPLLTFFMQIPKLAPPYNSYALKKTNSESQKFWSFLKISLKKRHGLKCFLK